MKTLVLAGFALALSTTSVLAQPRTLPRPFLTDTLSSAEEYAMIIETCEDVPKGTKLVATCEQLVESFNRAFKHVQVANYRELSAYIKDLAVKPCPGGYTNIARIVDGKVDLDYRREFREGERCLYDTGEGIFISSMSCGQWTPGVRKVFTAFVEEKKPEEPKPAPPVVQTPPPSDELPNALDRAAGRLSKSISDAAALMAAAGAQKAEAEDQKEPKPHPFAFLSWNRKSGKITLIGAAVGGALCAKYCRFTDTVTVITNVR